MMKKILLGTMLILSMLLVVTPFASAGEPPSCGGWTLIGPPLVGTWVIAYVSGPDEYGLYTLSFKFSGCCADCLEGKCNANKVSIEWPDTLPVGPEGILESDVQNYNVRGIISKKCNPIVNGVELQDAVLDTILTFEMRDMDSDGIYELVSQVVMYYYVCDV